MQEASICCDNQKMDHNSWTLFRNLQLWASSGSHGSCQEHEKHRHAALSISLALAKWILCRQYQIWFRLWGDFTISGKLMLQFV
jgi:hypothetical protein